MSQFEPIDLVYKIRTELQAFFSLYRCAPTPSNALFSVSNLGDNEARRMCSQLFRLQESR